MSQRSAWWVAGWLALPLAAQAWVEVSGDVSDQSWPAGTYWLSGDATINPGSTLSLAPGVVLKAAPGAQVVVYGSLSALGTEEAPIVITSQDDESAGESLPVSDGTPAPGDWDGIWCYGWDWYNGVAHLERCRLDYGGGPTGSAGANLHFYASDTGSFAHSISAHSANTGLLLQHCSPPITDSRFEYNQAHGLHALNAAGPLVTNNLFLGNGADAARLDSPFHSSYSGNSGGGNGRNGLVLSGSVSGSQAWSMGAPDFPFLLDANLSIQPAVSLSLAPGSVLKGGSGSSLIVYGSLSAPGSEALPIVFTSLKDDSHGGDSNGDGAASAPAAGDWDGIFCYGWDWYEGSGTFSHCQIAYGGGLSGSAGGNLHFLASDVASLEDCELDHSLSQGLTIQHCSPPILRNQFHHNGGIGCYGLSNAGPTLTDNVFTDNGAQAVWLDTPYHTSYSGNSGSGNGLDGLCVRGSVSAALNWSQGAPDFPFVLSGDLVIQPGQSLTLPAGSTLKADSEAGLVNYGTLSALGTETQPVTFTSLKDDSVAGDSNGDGSASLPAPGDWDGIYSHGFDWYNGAVQLEFCDLSYGGGNGGSSQANLHLMAPDNANLLSCRFSHSLSQGLTLQYGSPLIQDCRIEHNEGYGLYGVNNTNPVLLDNSFVDNAGYAVWLDTPYHTNYSGNTGSGNGIDALGVAGSVSAALEWSMGSGLPFLLTGDLIVQPGQSLSLSPGCLVKAAPDAGLLVYGSLSALGTESQPITFTSLQDDSVGGDTNGDGSLSLPAPGDWEGIYCYGYDWYEGVGLFEHVLIDYAGSAGGSAQGALLFYGSDEARLLRSTIRRSASQGLTLLYGTPLVQESAIDSCAGIGLYGLSNTSPTLQDNSFQGNGNYAVWLDTPYHTSYSGNTGSGNGVNGLGVRGGINSWLNWSMGTDLPFVLTGDLVVQSGMSLALSPGTLVKCDTDAELFSYGTLNLAGTAALPIVFTSLKDDSRGGDSNGDGSASEPAPGDWDGIYSYGYDWYDGSGIFRHLEVDYAGGAAGSSQAGLRFFHPTSVEMDHLVCRHNAGAGLRLENCWFPLSACLLTENQGAGLVIHSGAPVLGALDGSAGGGNGIHSNNGGAWQLENYSSSAIEAASTYWGLESPVSIDAHIYDDEEYASAGPVLFMPYLTATGAPIVTSLQTPPAQVQLSWWPAWGATGYRVYSSSSPYEGFSLDESGSISGLSWTAPRPLGEQRYYQVSALRD